MDLTPDFRVIAATCGKATAIPRVRQDYKPDAFLAEAQKLYRQMLDLQEYLERTRKAYLSSNTSSSAKSRIRHAKQGELSANESLQYLTETQRDEIDYEVKQSIREASSRVKELESLESTRRDNIDRSTSFLNRLLPDLQEKARNDLLSTHRSSITWFLNHKLLEISQRHAEAKTIRITREEEKRLAVQASGAQSTPVYAYDISEEDKTAQVETQMTVRETLLSAQQLEAFESENAQILQEFESQVSQIRSVQAKLMEIAELSSELQQHLAGQTEMTDRLLSEAEQTTVDVTSGNQQLSQAKRRNKTMRLYIVTIFLVLSFTLLFLDYYAS